MLIFKCINYYDYYRQMIIMLYCIRVIKFIFFFLKSNIYFNTNLNYTSTSWNLNNKCNLYNDKDPLR